MIEIILELVHISRESKIMAKIYNNIKRNLRIFDIGRAPICQYQSFYMVTNDPRIETPHFKKLMVVLKYIALFLLVIGACTSFVIAYRSYCTGMKP